MLVIEGSVLLIVVIVVSFVVADCVCVGFSKTTTFLFVVLLSLDIINALKANSLRLILL
jgi:hypothetical protein